MFLRWTPHKKALLIAWAIYLAFCGFVVYVLGADWWVPAMWPTAFILYMSFLIIRWERRIFRTTDAADHSETGNRAENLNRPPR